MHDHAFKFKRACKHAQELEKMKMTKIKIRKQI